ncbi:MAG: hypothetical protein Q9M14_05190 [Mariprofundaceae bacterium]|nr:hypothetical protein [Mariprofundaceae bacterium]
MMKKEYDFSKGERGRFFHTETTLNVPVYLDQDVESWFAEKAKSRGVELHDLVNKMLRKDISLIQEITGRS